MMKLRQRIRIFLESYDIFYKIRYSNFYLKKVQKKHHSIDLILQQERSYYLSLLKNIKAEKKIIFDIGANEGFVSSFFLEENYRVIAIEPDVRNQKILSSRFRNEPQFYLIKKGVSDTVKKASFFVHPTNSSLHTFSQKWKNSVESKNQSTQFLVNQSIRLTTLDQIIQKKGIPTFIKIDVEGHELEVIKGLNQKIPLLSFEANFPTFKEETLRVIEKLVQIDKESKFNFSIDYELKLQNFINGENLKNRLEEIKGELCLEVVCQMSIYPDYFNIEHP